VTVFAIAITLLVLELKVPDVAVAGTSPRALAAALLHQWPSYVGLVTSFSTVANHVGASPCDSSQRVQDRRVAAFCERLAAALCDVCSLPHFDFGGVPADECGKNGGGVLLGDFRVDRSEFLSVYPSSVPEAAAFIGRVARICGKDASRLHVRSPDVPDGDGFGVFKRPLVPGHLHAVVDFLGDDDHEEYAGLKATCRYVSTSVVGRDELTVLDVHVADIRRQAKFVAVFG